MSSSLSSVPEDASFSYRGRRINYCDYGEGPRVVVLTHGLLMNAPSMGMLRARLRHRGFDVHTFGYPSTSATLADNAKEIGPSKKA